MIHLTLPLPNQAISMSQEMWPGPRSRGACPFGRQGTAASGHFLPLPGVSIGNLKAPFTWNITVCMLRAHTTTSKSLWLETMTLHLSPV